MKKTSYKRSKYFYDEEHLVEIWGRSNCTYCDRAKKLCTKEGLTYRYYQLGEDYTREKLLELFPNVKTVPQIKVDNKYIGGYMELRTFLLGPPDPLFPDD